MATATISNRTTSASIAQSMLEEFERELVVTRGFLERVPADKLAWTPHAKSMTVGQLALHIAQIPRGVLTMSLTNQATVPDTSAPRPEPATVSEVLETLDRSADFVRETLTTIDDARMRSTFSVVDATGKRTLMSRPREGFLRHIMLNHWYHHRGQLGVYLRLLGVRVPPSYGPSADEAPF